MGSNHLSYEVFFASGTGWAIFKLLEPSREPVAPPIPGTKDGLPWKKGNADFYLLEIGACYCVYYCGC